MKLFTSRGKQKHKRAVNIYYKQKLVGFFGGQELLLLFTEFEMSRFNDLGHIHDRSFITQVMDVSLFLRYRHVFGLLEETVREHPEQV